ncbi:MAG TPA: bifunctional enoyl-CoA hydratase/phosphate acetyltransferase [Alphaproteobacteria bacterium]|nr:bifunctional enoyl-CoA hydratase/phosphate acetyltransferase [Alphaproteobacteria bacterium]
MPLPSSPKDLLENVTYDELTPGRAASLSATLAKKDIELFAAASGDLNPAHLDEDYARTDLFHGIVGHGMWLGAQISRVLGMVLPGPGTIYLEQDIKFKKPVRVGDKVTVKVSVREKPPSPKPVVIFDCLGVNQSGETVMEGKAVVLAPVERVRRPTPDMPDVEIQAHDRYRAIMQACRGKSAIKTAVVHPAEAHVLQAVADAIADNLIAPVLIGPRAPIEAAAKESGVDISKWELIDTPDSAAAAAKGAELAATGKVESIMKGSLHTEELLSAIVPSSVGLRTERRLSHVYVMDVPSYPKPLIVTDAVVNIAPDLTAKADICRNAIDFFHALAHENRPPKLAILAAVEVINPKMQATLDAAALCKMADRGEIAGGIIDGPLAFDNAISKEAAAEKGIVSQVAGDADILVVPEIESGNILAKQLTFLAHADAAGIVLGARVPIILTSRADNLRTRLLSCAMAVLLAAARREGRLK